jgi:hypothetical protein
MTRLTCWLVGMLRNRQTWALEYFLAYQSLVWGLWLLLPFGSFDAVPNAFTVLGLIPEPVWGVLFAAHGAVYLGVLWRRRVDLCRRAALVTAWLWLTVLVSLLLTIPLATSTPVYAGYAIACAVVYVRLDWFVGPRRRV